MSTESDRRGRCRYEDHRFLRTLNLILTLAAAGFIVGASILASNWLAINRAALETRYFPVVSDATARGWAKDERGFWGAALYIYKRRPECVYVPDQVVTATGITREGEPFEAAVEFVGDETPGANRAAGWNRLDERVVLLSDSVTAGSRFRMHFLHQCHAGMPTVTIVGPLVVGEEMPWPRFVQDWLDAGMKGGPSDYR